MPIDALVRVSLQSSQAGNLAVNKALVGHPTDPIGNGPFTKVGTAAYSVQKGVEAEVLAAIVQLTLLLRANPSELDFASITLVRYDGPGAVGNLF